MSRHSSTESSGNPRGEAQERGKRERILDAAVKVFADKGFYNAKVSEIARAAGVADGTIYLYFRSKDELLISLFEDRMQLVNDNVREAVRSEGDPLERLRQAVRTHLSLVERNRHDAEVLTVELRQSTKFMKEYASPGFGEFLRLLGGLVEEGQRAGQIRAELDPHLVARALFGAIDEISLSWLLRRRAAPSRRGEAQELARAAEQLADMFIDGLRRGGRGRSARNEETASTRRSS